MAVLSESDRAAVWIQWMRENRDAITGALTKAQLRAAVDAADSWADSNASEYNLALPAAARNALTPAQKALLLMFVVARRHGAGV